MTDTLIGCTVDLEAPGRQVGHLSLPRSDNESGWASTYIPIATLANGNGPTALVLGGNHGDEYEGQVACLKLIHELRLEQVNGRLIVMPCLSPPASRAGTRLWPSGANFNRSFPGRPDGAAHEMLAHYLTHRLFPRAEIVIDVHSGGRSTRFLPCSHMHVVEDPGQRRAMLEGMLAWNTAWHYLYIDVAGTGLLPVEAENQGKVVVTTELGGGGHVSAAVHRLAERGLRNVLRHFGILQGRKETRESMGLTPAVILDGRDPANYIPTPVSGLFEALVDPGDAVREGQPVARIYSREEPERAAVVVRSPLDGVTAAVRAISNAGQGDVVVVLGQPIEREAILQ